MGVFFFATTGTVRSYLKRASSSEQTVVCYSCHMNHKELIAALAEASETDSKTAAAMLSALTDLVLERVGSGDVVTIPRLAKFALADRAARVGRNPQTGEQLAIPAKRVAKITPTTAYKELAQRPL